MINCSSGLIHFVDRDNNLSWSFDRRGFFRSAVAPGVKYKRGWSGVVQEIKLRSAGGFSPKDARPLRLSQTEKKLNHFHVEVENFCRDFGEMETWQSYIGEYDSKKYYRNKQRFRQIWGSVPILPPDQYRALVFNLTAGCSYNNCNFCDFYRGIEFDYKDKNQFADHLRAAVDFFSGVHDFFTEIFLGSGDALSAPPDVLRRSLEMIGAVSVLAEKPVHAFAPGFIASLYGPEELNNLVERGLQRIYFGLESGSDAVLKKLNKPFTVDQLAAGIRLSREAGAHFGIIILIGAGGKKYSASHVEETIEFLNKLDFARGDRLFLSPLGEGKIGWAPGSTEQPMSDQEKIIQGQQIRAGLKDSVPVARYEVENFLY